MNEFSQERERIQREYRRRDRDLGAEFYALSKPANLFLRHSQERAFAAAVARLGGLGGRRLLEVGCGHGQWFSFWITLGASEAALAGIDLDGGRADIVRAAHPRADIRAGDASALPWPSAHFDVVFQSTVFTSILQPEMKAAIAAEMFRVLKPDGQLWWYDFAFDNPKNRQVRGIPRREVARLFPDCVMTTERITLAPPVARWLVPRSLTLASLLEQTRLLNSHIFAVLTPRP